MARTAKSSLLSIFIDLLLLFCAFLFITGASPFIQGSLQELIAAKPWMHRLGLAAVACFGFALAVGNMVGIRRYQWLPGPLTGFLLSNRLSALAWTWILFLTTSVLWTYSSWIRHETFHSGFDMAIFVQAIWNVLHGPFLYSSIKGGINLLGDHFSPFLAVLGLIYGLWAHPKFLLLLQAAAAVSSVFPIFLIAQNRFKQEAYGFLFALAFVLYLPVRNAVRFEFHPEIFAIPFLLWAFYFLIQKKDWRASLFLALSLITKENAALSTFIMGFYAFFFARRIMLGLFWMFFSIIYFYSVIHWVIPAISGQEYFYLEGNFLQWKELGIAALLKQIISKTSAAYIFKIFAPLGFLSFFDPATLLLTFPAILQNLTARNEAVRSIFFHYTAFLTPFVFISAIDGAARFPWKKIIPAYLVLTSLLLSGVSELYVMRGFQDKPSDHLQTIHRLLETIPADVSVRTHEFFAPHVAHRKEVHIYENDHPHEGGSDAALSSEYVVLDAGLLGANAESHYQALRDRGYRQKASENGLHIFYKSR